MANKTQPNIDYQRIELDGISYVILRETAFKFLCQKARIKPRDPFDDQGSTSRDTEMDQASLARKLVRRRRAANLSQAELARRAGIRPETLNRIERGRTTPDFATVRKLVVAMNAAETEHAAGLKE